MNHLLEEWRGPLGLPVFADIRDEDFGPAFDKALELARARVAAIAEGDAADFTGVIEGLELASIELNRVQGLFFNLASADSNPARESLTRDLVPRLSAFASEITSNKPLFHKIESLWNRRDDPSLSAEQQRVLDLYHRMFLRSGARLDGAAAERLAAIKARLARLGTEFRQNLLADERDWFMELTESDLLGLPEFVVDAASAAGVERNLGPVVTLNRSLIVPFLQFSPRRDLRRRACQAWVARGANGGKTDNRAIVTETLKLREEMAHLLGYADFAHFKLEPEMARSPDAVRDLLMQVWKPARAQADKDAAHLENLLQQDGIQGRLEPWDWRYYAAKRRHAELDLDESVLKPYFSLDSMLNAMFDCANRLFGLEFREIDGSFYHPDVRGWEVARAGQHLGVFLGDYFARGSKRSGAWCSAMRKQKKLGGAQYPIVVNVCNFAKGAPCLLSWDDAHTLFHEFGHALHLILSDVTYDFISGTSVARDFVELPSQLYEHWVELPEVLERHARHYQTHEPLPSDLRDRLLSARGFDQGFATVEYVASALVDLEFHSGPAPADPMQKQEDILAQIGMPPAIHMRHATPHFAHAFGGDGYASGYYSYMWSEILDEDVFAAFQEAGSAFDPETAMRLERCILSAGASKEPEDLYLEFRGRMPGVEALLKARGFSDQL